MKFILSAPQVTCNFFKCTGAVQPPQPDGFEGGDSANQSYPSKEYPERHWLLDHCIGRDVLIAQLRLGDPKFVLPWYVLRAPGLDLKLDPQIDVLGYRYVLPPTTQYEDFKAALRLLAIFAILAYRVLRSDIREMIKRSGK